MGPQKLPSARKPKKGSKGKRPQPKKGKPAIEKRKSPRFIVELPMDYSRKGKKPDFGGIIKNASENGILVYLPELLDVGELLKIDIFFAKGLELKTIQGVAKIVWADLAGRDTWKEHRYGLQFHSMPGGTLQKLRDLLKDIEKIDKPKGDL